MHACLFEKARKRQLLLFVPKASFAEIMQMQNDIQANLSINHPLMEAQPQQCLLTRTCLQILSLCLSRFVVSVLTSISYTILSTTEETNFGCYIKLHKQLNPQTNKQLPNSYGPSTAKKKHKPKKPQLSTKLKEQ